MKLWAVMITVKLLAEKLLKLGKAYDIEVFRGLIISIKF